MTKWNALADAKTPDCKLEEPDESKCQKQSSNCIIWRDLLHFQSQKSARLLFLSFTASLRPKSFPLSSNALLTHYSSKWVCCIRSIFGIAEKGPVYQHTTRIVLLRVRVPTTNNLFMSFVPNDPMNTITYEGESSQLFWREGLAWMTGGKKQQKPVLEKVPSFSRMTCGVSSERLIIGDT